jgi:DNA-binding MarR family transcriptional regulator
MHTANIVSAWVVTAHDALLEAAGYVGLDTRQLAALSLIASHPGCSIEWLRRRVGLTQSGTVRLVDRLQAEGLVRRGRPGSGRVELAMTAPGSRRLKRWNQARERVVEELTANLRPISRSDLVTALANSLSSRSRARDQADVACRTCDWPACGNRCPVDQSVG